jgi:hypothetical protein
LNEDILSYLEDQTTISQIINNYELVVPDSIITDPYKTFYNDLVQFDYVYPFDEYNRFGTLKEHVVEYISGVGTQKEALSFVNLDLPPGLKYSGLILLDGVPINSVDILKVNPYLIESASVAQSRVFFGVATFDGLINFKTYKGDRGGYKTNTIFDFTIPGAKSIDYVIRYNQNDQQSLGLQPVIYWNPSLKINTTPLEIQWPKNQVSGDYLLEIKGFTKENELVEYSEVVSINENNQ